MTKTLAEGIPQSQLATQALPCGCIVSAPSKREAQQVHQTCGEIRSNWARAQELARNGWALSEAGRIEMNDHWDYIKNHIAVQRRKLSSK